MKSRMNYYQAAPETIKALVGVEDVIKASGLELSLIELVKTRASQINGCAFCINMHTADARKNGETEQRLYLLNAWRESPLYTERERAALAWTEALTRLGPEGVPDDVYEEARVHFSEKELPEKDDPHGEGRAFSTKHNYRGYLKKWIIPRWGRFSIDDIKENEATDEN